MSRQPLRRADAANEASAHARVADNWRTAWPRFDRDGAGAGAGAVGGEDRGRWTDVVQNWKPASA